MSASKFDVGVDGAKSEIKVERMWMGTIGRCTSSYASTSEITRVGLRVEMLGEVGGWGRDPFSRNLMKPTPRRKWYLTTGRSFHEMVLDPIPQSLPVHFFGSRPQPPPLDVRQGLHLRCSFVYTSLHQCVS